MSSGQDNSQSIASLQERLEVALKYCKNEIEQEIIQAIHDIVSKTMVIYSTDYATQDEIIEQIARKTLSFQRKQLEKSLDDLVSYGVLQVKKSYFILNQEEKSYKIVT